MLYTQIYKKRPVSQPAITHKLKTLTKIFITKLMSCGAQIKLDLVRQAFQFVNVPV